MSGVAALLSKVEDHLENAPKESRAQSLCNIAEIISSGSMRLTREQLTQYDILLCRFSAEIEAIALSKLAFFFAHEERGPPKMVEFLARHEDILVAGRILAESPMLDDALLTQIAQSRPQSHLQAVCERVRLNEVVTSTILEHGDELTTRCLAKNSGAKFSNEGYATLVERSLSDDDLAETVGGRSDVPAHHLKLLLDRASDHVREKLIKSRPDISKIIKTAVADAARDVEEKAPAISSKLAEIHGKVAELYRNGELDSAALVNFAAQRKTDETLIAMALMCRIEPGAAYRVINEHGHDAVLMMASICELKWPEAKTVLLAIKVGMPADDVKSAGSSFARINPQMARKVLKMRLRPGAKSSAPRGTR